jgi:hypothetical protein
MRMLRPVVILLLSVVIGLGATTRLYLKDGTYQIVREYQVLQDRVKYYSTERGDWEEIPLELVDLKRTEGEAKRRADAEKQEAEMIDAEDKAERAERDEAARVPEEPGAYLVADAGLQAIPPADTRIVGDKKRTILKVLSPIPIVAGKGTLEIDGAQSKNVVPSDRPEFYLRLTAPQRFGIVRLAARKGNRVVEELSILPVTKEIIEKLDEVEIFRRQLAGGLYKIWPKAALTPGEYAVIEYTPAGDSGSLNILTWDFSVPGKR